MKREIRSSSVAGVAGTGAIIDVGQESFVIPGIERWRQSELRIVDLKRLSTRLHKVLKAPTDKKEPSLMVQRFPRAMFCEKCRKILRWKTGMERDGQEPKCQQDGCDGKLVPMRFVAACENGHLEDIDWGFWAHSGPNGNRGCKTNERLLFEVDAEVQNAGLGSLKVKCGDCGSYRSLEDLSNKSITKEIFRSCASMHPWIFGQQEQCDADVVVLQRGATNLHYPVTISALDIPADVADNQVSQFADQIRSQKSYQRLLELMRNIAGDYADFIDICIEAIVHAVGCDKEVVLAVANAELSGRAITSSAGQEDGQVLDQAVLLGEEWKTIEKALSQGGLTSEHFIAVSEELALSSPAWMKALVSGVLLIRRLREVRAYLGFHRVKPSTPEKMVSPDVGGQQPWLPASEVFGEGIVIKLNFGRLEKWAEKLPTIELETLKALERKRVDESFWFLPRVDPVFLAMHTLAHLLLRRITFECGYSSSSLRERLYFSREGKYAGIMIYTADGDSEGSLGGLVRQGRSDRLAQSLTEAVEQGRWCSSDPVCFETAGQGLGGFNHAACHACSLVSETSCIAANTLLDRRMLYQGSWGLLQFLEDV
ncbi:DrmB family protein [Aeromonas sp. 700377]|uniref:DrmB family protein n=1 Tax=Aeromonas sp. 700377 TaxID=2712056 RepID=UPI003BA1BDCC